MKVLKLLIFSVSILILIVGCISQNESRGEQNMIFGKNITITISEEETVDAKYLKNIYDGTIKKDIPYFDSLENDEFIKLIKYMEKNNYIIKPGRYTLNQAWEFDNGEFLLNNGERKRVFEFQENLID